MSTERARNAGDLPPEPIVITSHDGRRPPWLARDELARFLHQHMKPWEDHLEDVRRGIDYALSPAEGKGGFVLTAHAGEELVGGLVMLNTGMGGYVPEHLLLFVCIAPSRRGQGLGAAIIQRAIESCEGSVKLHVEPDNPALRLYRRLGFTNDYLEMRRAP